MVNIYFLKIILLFLNCLAAQDYCITFYSIDDPLSLCVYCISKDGNFVTSKSEYEGLKLNNNICNINFINLINKFQNYIEDNPNYCVNAIQRSEYNGYIALKIKDRDCIIDYKEKEFDNNLLSIIYSFKSLIRKCGKKYDAGYNGYGKIFLQIIQTQYELKAQKKKIRENFLNILQQALNASLNLNNFLNKWPHHLESKYEFLYEIFKDIERAINLYTTTKEGWQQSLGFKKLYIDYLIFKNIESYEEIKNIREKAFEELEKNENIEVEKFVYKLLKNKKQE